MSASVSLSMLLGRNFKPRMAFLVIAMNPVSNSCRWSRNGRNTKRRKYISGVSVSRSLSQSQQC